MKPKDLFLRCYAKRDGDIWVAVCIDLCLAAQARSLEEVKAKLDSQIHELVFDTLQGDEREFADLLLNRKAPLSDFATYHTIRLLNRFDGMLSRLPSRQNVYKERLPLVPALC